MKHISARDAARILQATESQIRSWSRMGALAPAEVPDPAADHDAARDAGNAASGDDGAAGGDLTFQDLVLLRTTKGLLEAGVSPRRVKRIWSSLRRQLADDLPLSSIRILADGDRAVAWDGSARWQPDSGQFLLDFEADEVTEGALAADTTLTEHALAGDASPAEDRPAPRLRLHRPEPAEAELATVVGLPSARGTTASPSTGDESLDESADESAGLTAEQWFHIGCELEDTSPLEARHAYMQALEADSNYTDAHLNLGRIDHVLGELGRAEAHYRAAAQSAPGDETCHFNLGVLLDDRGRQDEAILAYKRAIACDPEAADAHHNLGLLLDARGKRTDAMRHLMIARRLYAVKGRDG